MSSPIDFASEAENGTTLAWESGPRVAVLFDRIGPYHFARLRAAGTLLRVTAVEFSEKDLTYAWDLVKGSERFARLTLFEGAQLSELPSNRIRLRLEEVLDQIQPEVVAVPGWHHRCSLLALQWCQARNVPVVVMSETTAWDHPRQWWKELVKRHLLKLCPAAQVGGRSHAAYLEQLGFERKRIFFGYDVVDNDHFAKGAVTTRSNQDELRRQLGLPAHFFLASARFVKSKNLPHLIKAFGRYRKSVIGKLPVRGNGLDETKGEPWHLVLLGDGPLKSELVALVAELSLVDFVHFPGFQQYDELPAYYGLASVFVHASLTEPWGLVANEAMAAGLPMLLSNRCGCAADLLQESVNGFSFDPENEDELVRLMILISASEAPLAAMGAKSHEIVAGYSAEHFGSNLKSASDYALSHPLRSREFVGRLLLGLLVNPPFGISMSIDGILRKPVSTRMKPDLPALKKPNFFIIGAPKGGTTSMASYLREHPNIFFSGVKEPHFFDLDTSKSTKLSLPTYLSLFSGVDPNRHKAIGEGSTGYLFSRVAVSEILKFCPDAKFIVMLRNPADLVPAWHSEMVFEGIEDVREFEKAWRLESERRLGKCIPPTCLEPRKLFYSEWGKLGDQMERLFSVVDRRRVKVILFKDLVIDTRSVYEEVLAFLEVPSDGRKYFPTINENRVLRHPKLQRNLARAANGVRMLRAKTGLKLTLGFGLFPKLLLLNSKPGARSGLPPSLRAELISYYREDREKLSQIIGRDLSFWDPSLPQSQENHLRQTA